MTNERGRKSSFVRASDLAQMGVCEKQVQLADRLGPRRSVRQQEAADRGTDRHQRFHEDAMANGGVQSSEPNRGPCFIATAVFGESQETQTLRAFRDRFLAPHPIGRAAIRLYYRIGPHVADILRRGRRRRIFARSILRWVVRLLDASILRRHR